MNRFRACLPRLCCFCLLISVQVLFGGNILINQEARYSGSYGMRVELSDANPIYLVDETPAQLSRYRARFYINLDAVSLAHNQEVDVLIGLSLESRPVFRLFVTQDQAARQLGVALFDSGDNEIKAAPFTVGVGFMLVEVEFQAGANNGRITLLVNEGSAANIGQVDNQNAEVSTVCLGAIDGLSASSTGTFDLDDFVSTDSEAIGPLSCTPIYEYDFGMTHWSRHRSVLNLIPYISNPCPAP